MIAVVTVDILILTFGDIVVHCDYGFMCNVCNSFEFCL